MIERSDGRTSRARAAAWGTCLLRVLLGFRHLAVRQDAARIRQVEDLEDGHRACWQIRVVQVRLQQHLVLELEAFRHVGVEVVNVMHLRARLERDLRRRRADAGVKRALEAERVRAALVLEEGGNQLFSSMWRPP